MAVDLSRLRKIYGRFHPEEPPRLSEYVDFNGLRGDTVIEPLAREIALAERPLTRLFSGGRGVGKTTELKRLEAVFEDDGYTVVSMDAARSIDVNNADFPDVLVFMALSLIQELAEARRLAPFANAVRATREKLSETLRVINPTVDPKSVDLSVGVAKLGFNLRQRRTGEESLREQVEALTNDTIQAFRALVEALKETVKANEGAGLVLILDGTDKIVPHSGEGKIDQQERFFVQRATQLCDLGVHLILAAPISFCYSPKVADFNQTAGGQPSVLPTICLRDPESGDDTGHRKFVQVVEKRLAGAGVERADVFEQAALDTIIFASGGSPTTLMTLVRSVLTRAKELPVTQDVAEEAIRVESRGYFRQLDQAHYAVLKAYLAPNPVRPDDALGLECLFYTYLYEYVARSGDRKPWFEVNPIVRELSALRG